MGQVEKFLSQEVLWRVPVLFAENQMRVGTRKTAVSVSCHVI